MRIRCSRLGESEGKGRGRVGGGCGVVFLFAGDRKDQQRYSDNDKGFEKTVHESPRKCFFEEQDRGREEETQLGPVHLYKPVLENAMKPVSLLADSYKEINKIERLEQNFYNSL